MIIDYRSDTVTKPSAGMRDAMMSAEVGDDVFGEDPSVNRLEEMAAAMFGKEAAVFCSSGTQTNQIAIKCHTQPGDEVVCDADAHIYQYEGGGIGFNSGCSVKLLPGDFGRITARQVRENINNPGDYHKARTTLVCVENTSNRGGGSCYDFSELERIQTVCREHDLGYHIDGARLFNALVAKHEEPRQYGKLFDSISVCLSKSLGCPVGSLLLGDKNFITRARRIRKVFGGGMRQAGFLAAAGIYALQHNISRLQEDHQHAQEIASVLKNNKFVKEILPVQTNIIIFETRGINAPALVEKLKEKDILWYAIAPERVRLVLHLDITPEMVQKTIDVINSL
jgi:threonine aldolase